MAQADETQELSYSQDNPEDSDAHDDGYDPDGDSSEGSDQEEQASEADISDHDEEGNVAADKTTNPNGTFPLPHLP